MNVYLLRNIFWRWVIVNVGEPHLAWTGARWAPHRDGVQEVESLFQFYDREDAAECARADGFQVVAERAA